jgi:hypothetical protein
LSSQVDQIISYLVVAKDNKATLFGAKSMLKGEMGTVTITEGGEAGWCDAISHEYGMNHPFSARLEAGTKLVHAACYFCLIHGNKKYALGIEPVPALSNADRIDSWALSSAMSRLS